MTSLSYRGHRFPAPIIQHAIWLYLRFTLSYIEELLAERGLDLSYETIRRWMLKFGPAIARRLRPRRPRPGDRWHLDGVSRTHLRRMKVWGGPLDAGGQAQASNHCKLLSSKAMVVSVAAKGGT
jgi:putative transposase